MITTNEDDGRRLLEILLYALACMDRLDTRELCMSRRGVFIKSGRALRVGKAKLFIIISWYMILVLCRNMVCFVVGFELVHETDAVSPMQSQLGPRQMPILVIPEL